MGLFVDLVLSILVWIPYPCSCPCPFLFHHLYSYLFRLLFLFLSTSLFLFRLGPPLLEHAAVAVVSAAVAADSCWGFCELDCERDPRPPRLRRGPPPGFSTAGIE